MAKINMNHYITNPYPDRAFLVGIDFPGIKSNWSIEDALCELEELAKTAGVQVAGRMYQRLKKPRPATYIGSGKVEELKRITIKTGANTVIINDELSPGQQKNLELELGDDIKVIDRTALILDIFARHAYSREGQIQVELAQYEYRLPRLTRLWTHLVRQAGGRAGGQTYGVGLRGPGETQLEVDRRLIKKRILSLKKELEYVRHHRKHHRTQRKKRGMKVITLVGYTNAGKSSILNALSHAHIKTEDKLFASLDPITRRVILPGGRYVLFTDTVGFIKNLPHNLVAAFRATLEGITDADLLLHIADISHPMVKAQIDTTKKVLSDQGVADKQTLLVWNKIDLVQDSDNTYGAFESETLKISARTGEGLDILLARIERMFNMEMIKIDAEIPYFQGKVLNKIFKYGHVNNISYNTYGVRIQALIPASLKKQVIKYRI